VFDWLEEAFTTGHRAKQLRRGCRHRCEQGVQNLLNWTKSRRRNRWSIDNRHVDERRHRGAVDGRRQQRDFTLLWQANSNPICGPWLAGAALGESARHSGQGRRALDSCYLQQTTAGGARRGRSLMIEFSSSIPNSVVANLGVRVSCRPNSEAPFANILARQH